MSELYIPETCPYCGQPQVPEACFSSPFLSNKPFGNFYFGVQVFRCLNRSCMAFFLQTYQYQNLGKRWVPVETKLPLGKVDIEFNDSITVLSPNFIDIYTESNQAEHLGLMKICGMGYRKSVEYLIKDYSTYKVPDDTQKIKNEPLNQVITNYLSDFPKLQHLAKAATWLGNDQTHYLQKYSDDSLKSMKEYIKSAVLFIEADLSADESNDFLNQ